MKKGVLQLALGLVLFCAVAAGAVPLVVSFDLPANGSTCAVLAAFVVSPGAFDYTRLTCGPGADPRLCAHRLRVRP